MIVRFFRNRRLNALINQSVDVFVKLSQIEKAYCLIMVSDYFFKAEKDNPILASTFRSPENYSSEQCYKLYSLTESFKTYQENALRKQEQHFNSMGINLASLTEPNHGKMLYVGILFLLVRLACFIDHNNKSEAVTAIKVVTQNIKQKNIDDAFQDYAKVMHVSKTFNVSGEEADEAYLRKTINEILQSCSS